MITIADLEREILPPAGTKLSLVIRRVIARGTILNGARLEGRILKGARLERAGLKDAHLEGANLTGAILTGAHLEGANLTGVIGANFAGAIGVNVNIAPPVDDAGIAFQVHNAFKTLKIVKFMEIIRNNITPKRIGGELLEKLITYSETNLPAKTEELRHINATIKTYGGKNGNDVQDVITFVLLQPVPFKQMYITNFTEDCLNAYNVGNRVSCVKGQYERVFMNLEGVLGFTCNQVGTVGTVGTVCHLVYKELLACFKPDYNKLFGDWFALGQDADAVINYDNNKSPKKKKAYVNAKKIEFKAYVFEQMGERHDIDEYIDAAFSGYYAQTYKGGRKRKTNKQINAKRKTKTEKRKG